MHIDRNTCVESAYTDTQTQTSTGLEAQTCTHAVTIQRQSSSTALNDGGGLLTCVYSTFQLYLGLLFLERVKNISLLRGAVSQCVTMALSRLCVEPSRQAEADLPPRTDN